MTVNAKQIKNAVVAGLVAGVIFGIIMTMMGMMPMIAAIVGSSSVAVGWILHLIISAVIGAGFALLFRQGKAVVNGLIYGFIWYLLGPLTLMPVFLGMGLTWSAQAVADSIPSLVGHLLFGLILGFVYRRLSPQTRTAAESQPA